MSAMLEQIMFAIKVVGLLQNLENASQDIRTTKTLRLSTEKSDNVWLEI